MPMLTPALVLIAWTLVVWAWMYATRIPAMQKAGIAPQAAAFTSELTQLPAGPRQVAANYNHLMEQPTIFYATVVITQLLGQADSLNVGLAWGYVGLRIVHSLIQNTVNIVLYRWLAFTVSTLLLAVIVVRDLLTAF
jgi:hypothetical protein